MKKLQIAIAADHLERYHRCKRQLDSCSVAQVRAWLERLPAMEQALCRIVLNNIRAGRKAKRDGVPLSEVIPVVASDELRAAHEAAISQQLTQLQERNTI